MRRRALATALARLLEGGSGRLAGSKLTTAQRRALDEFRARTGAVQQQRSGRGVIYLVTDRTVVERHLQELSPLDVTQQEHALPQRAANIARTRSSKAGPHGHETYYLLLKARGPVHWQSERGHTLDLQQATDLQGAAVLAIGGDNADDWYSASALWLVENQALFDRLDWLPGNEAASVACYGGQLRTRLLHWLQARPRAPHIHLFPDYDGVGLHNYLRIRQRLGDQVSLWMMPHWEQRLRRFGSNALWQDTARDFRAALPGLRSMAADEAPLQHLLLLMQQLGLALEQEAVWLW